MATPERSWILTGKYRDRTHTNKMPCSVRSVWESKNSQWRAQMGIAGRSIKHVKKGDQIHRRYCAWSLCWALERQNQPSQASWALLDRDACSFRDAKPKRLRFQERESCLFFIFYVPKPKNGAPELVNGLRAVCFRNVIPICRRSQLI
jgi:hypothetical protein